MFLEAVGAPEPPGAVLALEAARAVTPDHVVLQHGLSDEPDLTLPALKLTLLLAEGRVELVVQEVSVLLVTSLQVLLNVLLSHNPDLTELTPVDNPRVFLLQVARVTRDTN